MTAIDAIRLGGTIAWFAVLCLSARPLARVFRGTADVYDPLWALFAGIAMMVIGYHMHWLVFTKGQAVTVYLLLNVFSLLLGLMTAWILYNYKGAHHD